MLNFGIDIIVLEIQVRITIEKQQFQMWLTMNKKKKN